MMRNATLALLMAIVVIGVGAPPSQAVEDGWKDCLAVEPGQSCPAGTKEVGKGYCCPDHHFKK